MRTRVLRDQVRMDGRGPRDIRALTAEVDVLPRVHGSALFERGETQILGVTTLNMLRMEQNIDTLSPEKHKRYMHNYNFPPYSTGETGRVGSPKRREIGHGALAERALIPVLPAREEFPYAIRQVSEALGSNGSTSMGSVCASTMSLLAAGVPLKAPVAGIAMGLISDEVDGKTTYISLTDILGSEDAFGDMDFKVAGTRDFVTALQLDTKLDGIPSDVLAGALQQAHDARQTILDVMAEAIESPAGMSQYAPRVTSVKIPVDKIGMVIGPKGQTINAIQDETGAEISIEDDGTIYVGATDGPSAQAAIDRINAIANPTMPKVGDKFLGTVVKTAAFGAFVSLLPGRDGLLHISKVGDGKRVDRVEDFLNVGDKVEVEIAEIDGRGKIYLDKKRPEGAEAPAAAEGARRRATTGRRAAAVTVVRATAATGATAAPATVVRAGLRRPRARAAARAASAVGAPATAEPEHLPVTRTRTWTIADDPLGGTVRRTVLPNGLRILTEAVPAMRSVSFGVWVGVGSRDETRSLSGVSHFLEHLLFKGTRRRSAMDISSAIEAVGGETNAFTTKEYTCYYARVLDADLPLAVDVMCDLVVDSVLAESDVETERGVILEEIAMHDDEPGEEVHDLFTSATYGDHPLGRLISGTVDTISPMTRRQIQTFYHRRYTPATIVIAAAGNLDHAQWSSRSGRRSPGPSGSRRPTSRARGAASATARRPRPGAGSWSYATRTPSRRTWCWAGPASRGPTSAGSPSACSTTSLGGGMSSRLFQEIREKRGLAYSVYSYTSQYADTGLFGVYAGCAPGKVDEVLALTREELARVAADGLTAEEITRGKGMYKGSLVLGLEDTGSRMSRLGKGELLYDELLSVDDILARVDAVTAEQIHEVAAAGARPADVARRHRSVRQARLLFRARAGQAATRRSACIRLSV